MIEFYCKVCLSPLKQGEIALLEGDSTMELLCYECYCDTVRLYEIMSKFQEERDA